MTIAKRHTMIFLAPVLALLAVTGAAPAQDTPASAPENPVCGPDVDSWQIDLDSLGPALQGTWQGVAPGLGMTTGVQNFPVTISFKNGRLYVGGAGPTVELHPARGQRKALRYDFVNQRALPEAAHAVDLSLDEMSVVTNCDLDIAPQFSWEYGKGARRSAGIYTFLTPTMAVGTMWNNARGAREVYLSR